MVIFAIGLISLVLIPDLWRDNVAIFSSLGGFVTVYGVAFAVIETWRARSASEMAESAAKEASSNVTKILNIKNISECKQCIRSTILDLEKDGWASTSALTRILELYVSEFCNEYVDENSNQRNLVASLRSHAANASGPLKQAACKRLKATLVDMLSHLTIADNEKMMERKQ
jgi:hypothetical protein